MDDGLTALTPAGLARLQSMSVYGRYPVLASDFSREVLLLVRPLTLTVQLCHLSN